MYANYFGLKHAPFSISPNPRFLFMSQKHREALGHLLYGVGVGGGFVLLTGEVGTGKTTICRCLLEQMPENTDIAFVLNPLQNAKEMLETICDELRIAVDSDAKSLRGLSTALYKFLLANHARGRNTVLLIDEAQNLDTKVLELIRLLTNLETNTKKLLQIIFIGQPELQVMLERPELRQLAQRITARFHIEPLNLEETQAYIRHRLQVAGLPANQVLFAPAIVRRIHRRSGGIPRLINVLCDRTLLGAYAENKTTVDKSTLSKAALEVLGEKVGRYSPTRFWQGAAILLTTIIATAVAARYWPVEQVIALDTKPSVQPAVQPSMVPTPPLSEAQKLTLASYPTEAQALSALFAYLRQPQLSGPAPCEDTRGTGMTCSRVSVKNWHGFLHYNRPAVLQLSNLNGVDSYVAVLGIAGAQAWLLNRDLLEPHALMTLGNLWTGDFVFAWAGPEMYDKPLAIGDRGDQVRWVANHFALLDQQDKPLTEDRFNAALKDRVKIFQQSQQLEADGIVGLQTLLKLNEVLGIDRVLAIPTLTGAPTLDAAVNRQPNDGQAQ